MKKLIAGLVLLSAFLAFGADNIIVPVNQGKAYLKDAGGKLWPASISYTTDGNGNAIPISAGGGGGGTVSQGAPGPMASPWPVAVVSLPSPVPVTGTFFQATQPVSVASPVPVTGTFFQATQPVSIASPVPVTGTFFQATQPVSIASPVPVTAASLPLPTGAATEATLSALNAKVTAVDTGSVVVSSSALPTGAATAAKQDTGNTSLSSIDGKIPASLTVTSTRLLVDPSGVTSPVSAASLPLPTGASTSANQSTEISSLSSIDGKIPASLTVTSTRLLVDPSGVTSPISAASLPLPAGAATEAKQDTSNTSLASIDSKLTSPLVVKPAVTTTGSTYGNKNYTTAAKASVGASALSGRRLLVVTPINVDVYWGYDSSVTTTNGLPIFAGETAKFDIDDTQDVYLISSSGTADVRLAEGK